MANALDFAEVGAVVRMEADCDPIEQGLGHLLALLVTPAVAQDRAQVEALAAHVQR